MIFPFVSIAWMQQGPRTPHGRIRHPPDGIIFLEDDIDGSKASETILFARDGVEYAIDLNDAHASALREAFSRFTKAARKTGGRTRSARHGFSNPREVRLWAAGQGLQVNTCQRSRHRPGRHCGTSVRVICDYSD
jgi:hypothetical protein